MLPISSTRYCCKTMESMYVQRGMRGFCVLGRERDSRAEFFLCARVVSLGEEPEFRQEIAGIRTPFLSRLNVAIVWCPWCGKNLRKFYSGDRKTSLIDADFQDEIG